MKILYSIFFIIIFFFMYLQLSPDSKLPLEERIAAENLIKNETSISQPSITSLPVSPQKVLSEPHVFPSKAEKWSGPAKGFNLGKAKTFFDQMLVDMKKDFSLQSHEKIMHAISRHFYPYEVDDAYELAIRYFEYKNSINELAYNTGYSKEDSLQQYTLYKNDLKTRVFENLEVNELISDEIKIDSILEKIYSENANDRRAMLGDSGRIKSICGESTDCINRIYTIFKAPLQ